MAVQELLDGFDHVETRAEFDALLGRGKSLIVKLGLDPTTPDLHLGHAVVLRKLQEFVEGGHQVVLIIGDGTARIGDPSGRKAMRPPLTQDEIRANMVTYAQQAGKVLDMERVQVRYNSEWLDKLSFGDILKLLAQVTVAQMLARNDFAQRHGQNEPIALHEFLYPVAQAYDSVAIAADLELGGNDQLFNLLMGREYQANAGQRRQVIGTTPLLEGLDGVKKMSKSAGNYVGITEPARLQFGKLMSLPDDLIPRYAQLVALRPKDQCARLAADLAAGVAKPMEEKKKLAQEIVALYHGGPEADAARDYFERTVQRKELPSGDLPEIRLRDARRVPDVMVAAGLAESKRAAERLISGKGVKVDGILVHDPRAPWTWPQPAVLSVGSRKFVRIVPDQS
ncbi:MAG: tyrosine--tRNA ligase [Candidatus Meridianibacter frigidus]|nr:MAG: tyrosine--tRNA ligase [Candidatus Eremiobacteraeota bacterium]